MVYWVWVICRLVMHVWEVSGETVSPPIRMLLWDRDDRTYGYYIEVSTDQKTWTRIVDRSNDSCQ